MDLNSPSRSSHAEQSMEQKESEPYIVTDPKAPSKQPTHEPVAVDVPEGDSTYDTASCWSKMWVLHVVPLMQTALKRTITEFDVGVVPKDNRAHPNEVAISSEWDVRCAGIDADAFRRAFRNVVSSDSGRRLIKNPEAAWAALRKRVEAGEFRSWRDHQDFHEAVEQVAKGAYKEADPGCALCGLAAAVPQLSCPPPLGMPKIKGVPSPSKKHKDLEGVLKGILGASKAIAPNMLAIAYHVNRKGLWWGAGWGLLQGSTVFSSVFLIPELTDVLLGLQPTWKGYIYAGVAFVSIVIMAFGMMVMFVACLNFAQQLRAQLATVLHSKAMRLSKQGWRAMGDHGKIFNLLNTDVDTVFQQSYMMMGMILYIPMQMLFAVAMLFYILSWPTACGLVVMAVSMPYNYRVGNEMISAFIGRMQVSDTRVKKQHELIEHIRGVKFFCWEDEALKQVETLRETEVKQVSILLRTLAKLLFSVAFAPYLFQGVILIVYAIFYEDDLTVSKLFQSVAIAAILRMSFGVVPMIYSQYLTAYAALNRIGTFLMQDETRKATPDPHGVADDGRVEIRKGNFKWHKTAEVHTLKDVSMLANKGDLVMVVGKVGSGKSSLMEGLLSEMVFEGDFIHLGGSVAYCPQCPWVFNATLRDNVTWHQPWSSSKYERIVDAVCLGPDIDMLMYGDMTEIGEKGINLSGGQKARVSLARACYCEADICLLDDPLSAVDAHVGKNIFERVINGLMRGRTRILVTNQLQYLDRADTIYVVHGGTLIKEDLAEARATLSTTPEAQRSVLQELLAEFQSRQESVKDTSAVGLVTLAAAIAADFFIDPELQDCIRKPLSGPLQVAALPAEQVAAPAQRQGGDKAAKDLIQEEDIEEGDVTVGTFWSYMKHFGGSTTCGHVTWWSLLFGAHILQNLTERFSQIWLGWYVDEGREQSLGWYQGYIITKDYPTYFWLGVYLAILIVGSAIIGVREWFYARGALRPCRDLAKDHCMAVLRSPTDFFDTTPIGRIITRFTFDWMALDFQVPMSFMMTITQFGILFTSLIVMALAIPWFLCAAPFIGLAYWWVVRMDKASLQLRRIFNKTKSPVTDVFATTLHGLSTIRAFGRQSQVIQEEYNAIDKNNAAFAAERFAFEWVRLRVNLIGAFIVGVAFTLMVILKDSLTPATLGFLISQCTFFVSTVGLAFLTRQELNMAMNSIERIKSHIKLPPEETDEMRENAHQPPADWPSKGEIDIKHMYVRYRPGLPIVLSDICIQIKAGWRVGVCGRTGGGKSTLLKAMFRLMKPEHTFPNGSPTNFSFMIDGVPAHKLSLKALRSAMAIIPQEPVVFSGSVRRNVDPFDNHPDAAHIWQAVRACHLEPHIRRRAADSVKPTRWELPEGGSVDMTHLKVTATKCADEFRCDDDGVMRTLAGFQKRHGERAAQLWADATDPVTNPAERLVGQSVLEVNGTKMIATKDAELAIGTGGAVITIGSDPLEIEVTDDSLSVGQRQLLCLARALVLRRKILLLDEATASVDVVTDALIQKTLITEFKGVTQIAVAHRLNTIVDCDRILVLVPSRSSNQQEEGGKVAQFASFDTLVADKEGPFHNLAKEAGLLHE